MCVDNQPATFTASKTATMQHADHIISVFVICCGWNWVIYGPRKYYVTKAICRGTKIMSYDKPQQKNKQSTTEYATALLPEQIVTLNQQTQWRHSSSQRNTPATHTNTNKQY